MQTEKPKGPAFTTSKAKKKKRRDARYVPRMNRAEAVAVVERTWGARKPKRAPRERRHYTYVAGPFGPPIRLGEIFGQFANCRSHGGGLTYRARP